jgi:hypothetical protein
MGTYLITFENGRSQIVCTDFYWIAYAILATEINPDEIVSASRIMGSLAIEIPWAAIRRAALAVHQMRAAHE